MSLELYMVDVFAERAYTGNPLAVIVGDTFPADDVMQQLALEINYSETTFVRRQPDNDGSYRVRVFTPSREIAFTGHPILGTAWVVREYLINMPCDEVRLGLKVGSVPVRFEQSDAGNEIAWFQSPELKLGKTVTREDVAAAIGLETEALVTSMPLQIVSAETSAIIVPVNSRDALLRSCPDTAEFTRLAKAGLPPLTYLYCYEPLDPGNDVIARFYFEAHGMREDPATGNGAAFLGRYLLAHTLHEGGPALLKIEQGYNLNRPSLIYLQAALDVSGNADIRVGGHVVPVAVGKLVE